MSRIVAVLVLVCAISRPGMAQSHRTVLFKAQNSNWIVRAISQTDSTDAGRVLHVTSDSVRIGNNVMALERIFVIDRRVRDGSGGGGAALAGGLGLGLLGLGLSAAWCSGDCSSLQLAGGTAMGATLGVTLGGLIGATTAPGTYRWVSVWRRE